jgi:hypothetical protein
MSEDGISEGVISKIELAELAELFDKFEFAFDPRSTPTKEAESDFENKVRQIFEGKIHPMWPNVGFAIFHCRVKSLCREYLKKNSP